MIAVETPAAASAQEIPQLFGGRPGHQGAPFMYSNDRSNQ